MNIWGDSYLLGLGNYGKVIFGFTVLGGFIIHRSLWIGFNPVPLHHFAWGVSFDRYEILYHSLLAEVVPGALSVKLPPSQTVYTAELPAVKDALMSVPPLDHEVVVCLDNKAVFDTCVDSVT
eukprot:501791-Amphidinium_carterae.3